MLVCNKIGFHKSRSECLGEIGAIDPGRLDIVIRPEIRCDEPDKKELALVLIRDYLCKIMRDTSSTEQVCVEF